MNNWKTCKHEWKAVAKYSSFGVVYQDECVNCESIGVLADKADENGMVHIVAQPQADVIDFSDFKKRKETQNVEKSGFSGKGDGEGKEKLLGSEGQD
jgi:hypothetical protein